MGMPVFHVYRMRITPSNPNATRRSYIMAAEQSETARPPQIGKAIDFSYETGFADNPFDIVRRLREIMNEKNSDIIEEARMGGAGAIIERANDGRSLTARAGMRYDVPPDLPHYQPTTGRFLHAALL